MASTKPRYRAQDANRLAPSGCQDVVKKPKLDSHGARCHTSFTCIDCSKTFAGPAQWKSHTSCVSEEQKYHKSVYQEPRGRGRGRGQRGRGGARGGFARAPYSGSGENSVPLGSQANAWIAPPPDPVNNAPFDSTEWTVTTKPAAEAAPTPQTDAPEPGSKESKRSKKRKTEDVEMAEPAPASDEPAKKKKKSRLASEPESTTDKKEKKKKSRELKATDQDGDVTMTDAAAGVAVNGKEHKPKKSRKSETLANGEPTAVASPNSTPDEPPAVPTDESPKKKKKSRKSEAGERATDEPNTLIDAVPTTSAEPVMNGHSSDKKRKDKKSKTEKSNGISGLSVSDEPPSAPDANDLIPISTIESEVHLNKKERQKKAKKEKKEQAKAEAKAREAELLALEPSAPRNDATADGAMLKPRKSKKEKEKAVGIVGETGASEDAPKEKKKKSKWEKTEKETAA